MAVIKCKLPFPEIMDDLTDSCITQCNQSSAVLLNGSIFNITQLGEDNDKSDFGSSKFECGTMPDGSSVLVDTSRGLAVLTVGDIQNVGAVTLSTPIDLSHLSSSHLLCHESEVPSQPPAQLFAVQGDGDLDSQADLETTRTADPNQLQLVPTAMPVLLSHASEDNAIPSPASPKQKRRGGWPKGKKRKPEKENSAPKAPASAYVIFTIQRRQEIRKQLPNMPFPKVTKLLGNEWSAMTPEQKQKYFKAADADKRRYIDELKVYQQSDAYKSYLNKKRQKNQQSGVESATDANNFASDLETKELYCHICDMYFSSLHNRKEHIFGKTHLQNVTSEFEKDMAEEQEEAAALAAEEAALTESSRQLLGGTHTIAEPLDIEACIHRFIEKNNDRETEIRELKNALDSAKVQNATIVQQIQALQDIETDIKQQMSVGKSIGITLAAQIDTLKMVPMLFGVINF